MMLSIHQLVQALENIIDHQYAEDMQCVKITSGNREKLSKCLTQHIFNKRLNLINTVLHQELMRINTL